MVLCRVERGACLGKPPAALIAAAALPDEGAFASGEQNPVLVDAVQGRVAGLGCAGEAPRDLLLGILEIGEQMALNGLPPATAAGRGLRLVLAEERFGTFGDQAQSGLITLNLHQVRQFVQASAETLGDLPVRAAAYSGGPNHLDRRSARGFPPTRQLRCIVTDLESP